MSKFDAFFKVRRNVIYERARFNRRSQQPGETSEQFIMALYELADNCEYGEMKDEMIRDRIVVGIRDISLSERLQLDSALTLETAKKAVRQREAVHEQNQALTATTTPSSIAAIQPGRKQRAQNKGTKMNYRRKQQTGKTQACSRCGREPHLHGNCPAKDAVCSKCGKRNHFAAVCRTKTSTANEVTGSSPDAAFLDNLTPESNGTVWTAPVKLCERITTFKIDMGAEVTAVSEETYQQLRAPVLNTPDRKLFGPFAQPLKVLGSFKERLTYK